MRGPAEKNWPCAVISYSILIFGGLCGFMSLIAAIRTMSVPHGNMRCSWRWTSLFSLLQYSTVWLPVFRKNLLCLQNCENRASRLLENIDSHQTTLRHNSEHLHWIRFIPFIVANRWSTGSFSWLFWSVQKPLTIVTTDLGVARGAGGWCGRPDPRVMAGKGGKMNVLNLKKLFSVLNEFEITEPNISKFN